MKWLYPDRSYADVLAEWSTRGPSLVVFTRSADGALARLPSGLEVGVGGIDVEVVDTIGAGDTFTAGLLHALDEAGLLNALRHLHNWAPSRSKRRCGSPSWCRRLRVRAPDLTRRT